MLTQADLYVARENRVIVVDTFTSLTLRCRLGGLLVRPRRPSGKASASTAEDPGFESRLRRDFFGVKSYQ